MLFAAAIASGLYSLPAQASGGRLSLRFAAVGAAPGTGVGVLIFKGKKYPVAVSGLGPSADVGASNADLAITNLRALHNIEGVYTAVTISSASSAATLRLINARGVVLRVSGREVGFRLSTTLNGMRLTLK